LSKRSTPARSPVLIMAPDDIEKTKRLMGALLRMPPKPHSEMKIGKSKTKPTKSPGQNPTSAGASAKPRTGERRGG
jgi:hypothetical protein